MERWTLLCCNNESKVVEIDEKFLLFDHFANNRFLEKKLKWGQRSSKSLGGRRGGSLCVRGPG